MVVLVTITQRVQLGGLLVAFSGFGITRLFVAESVQVDVALPFLLAGLIPLVVGLAMTIYGVALAVGPFSNRYVNTIARWHLLGVGVMILVFAITDMDGLMAGEGLLFGTNTRLLVANVLLGGAVGGTLTGMRSAKLLRQRREIQRSANQALLVNRLLKHEVINAATIIDGYASLLADQGGDRSESVSAIQESAERINTTIEEVGAIATNEGEYGTVDAAAIVRDAIDAVDPGGVLDIRLSVRTDDTEIVGDERLQVVVKELLENAIVHGETDTISVDLTAAPHALAVSITDDGPGLPGTQRRLLEDGVFPEYDDPTAGFGLQFVRLLVVQFGGTISVTTPVTDDGGSRITVELPRGDREAVTAETVGLTFPNMSRALVGGLLGGIVMGSYYQLSTGLLLVIGSLYGVETALVGWILHLFHSAVFGLLFAAICALPRMGRLASGPLRTGLLGLGWGVVLWLVAAGVMMPAWLTLLGDPTPIPALTLDGLIGHALWGIVLGVAYWGLGDIPGFDRD